MKDTDKAPGAGRILGIGVGIGDPEDITLKAARLIKSSDILICPKKDLGRCRAYQIAKQVIPEVGDIETLSLEFEMVKDEKERDRNHREIYRTVKELVNNGKTVTFLTIGDPSVYSTYSYIAELAREDGIETLAVSGISSITAVANSLGITLCEKDVQLHVIPDTDDIESALFHQGTKVIMKCGRDMRRIKEILRKRSGISVYAVSDCGMPQERCYRGIDELPEEGSYMLTVIVKEMEPMDHFYAEAKMDLAGYDGKNVIIRDIYGETFTGIAEYGGRDFLECEYGGDEDGIFIEDVLLYNSQIGSIEESAADGEKHDRKNL
ncbi:MAG: precorrin-2 C(20)-methyltransferase [Lachnospiraceae bacterium]|nr:precorrin-2 C(20)-methyltransferase [Lachnospiraceae bacterium]